MIRKGSDHSHRLRPTLQFGRTEGCNGGRRSPTHSLAFVRSVYTTSSEKKRPKVISLRTRTVRPATVVGTETFYTRKTCKSRAILSLWITGKWVGSYPPVYETEKPRE